MKLLLTALVLGTGLAFAPARGGAQEPFPAPGVSVFVSELTPGGHPDLQTVIDIPTGLGFDSLRVTAPRGGSIASDGDIADGTAVGRLDATATTNLGTQPECNVPVTFTVAIREATTDITSPDYPPYLRALAPGRHRLRLVADVSPSSSAPILINYLFDIDPLTTSPILQALVGDPDNPPPGFLACPPQSSRNTFFGITPDGTPLTTSPDPLPDEPLPFVFEFTSRPDAEGERYTQTVETVAGEAEIDLERVGLPEDAPTPAPTDRTDPDLMGGPDTGPAPPPSGIAAPSTGTGPASRGGGAWPIGLALVAAGAAALAFGLRRRVSEGTTRPSTIDH